MEKNHSIWRSSVLKSAGDCRVKVGTKMMRVLQLEWFEGHIKMAWWAKFGPVFDTQYKRDGVTIYENISFVPYSKD